MQSQAAVIASARQHLEGWRDENCPLLMPSFVTFDRESRSSVAALIDRISLTFVDPQIDVARAHIEGAKGIDALGSDAELILESLRTELLIEAWQLVVDAWAADLEANIGDFTNTYAGSTDLRAHARVPSDQDLSGASLLFLRTERGAEVTQLRTATTQWWDEWLSPVLFDYRPTEADLRLKTAYQAVDDRLATLDEVLALSQADDDRAAPPHPLAHCQLKQLQAACEKARQTTQPIAVGERLDALKRAQVSEQAHHHLSQAYRTVAAALAMLDAPDGFEAFAIEQAAEDIVMGRIEWRPQVDVLPTIRRSLVEWLPGDEPDALPRRSKSLDALIGEIDVHLECAVRYCPERGADAKLQQHVELLVIARGELMSRIADQESTLVPCAQAALILLRPTTVSRRLITGPEKTFLKVLNGTPSRADEPLVAEVAMTFSRRSGAATLALDGPGPESADAYEALRDYTAYLASSAGAIPRLWPKILAAIAETIDNPFGDRRPYRLLVEAVLKQRPELVNDLAIALGDTSLVLEALSLASKKAVDKKRLQEELVSSVFTRVGQELDWFEKPKKPKKSRAETSPIVMSPIDAIEDMGFEVEEVHAITAETSGAEAAAIVVEAALSAVGDDWISAALDLRTINLRQDRFRLLGATHQDGEVRDALGFIEARYGINLQACFAERSDALTANEALQGARLLEPTVWNLLTRRTAEALERREAELDAAIAGRSQPTEIQFGTENMPLWALSGRISAMATHSGPYRLDAGRDDARSVEKREAFQGKLPVLTYRQGPIATNADRHLAEVMRRVTVATRPKGETGDYVVSDGTGTRRALADLHRSTLAGSDRTTVVQTNLDIVRDLMRANQAQDTGDEGQQALAAAAQRYENTFRRAQRAGLGEAAEQWCAVSPFHHAVSELVALVEVLGAALEPSAINRAIRDQLAETEASDPCRTTRNAVLNEILQPMLDFTDVRAPLVTKTMLGFEECTFPELKGQLTFLDGLRQTLREPLYGLRRPIHGLCLLWRALDEDVDTDRDLPEIVADLTAHRERLAMALTYTPDLADEVIAALKERLDTWRESSDSVQDGRARNRERLAARRRDFTVALRLLEACPKLRTALGALPPSFLAWCEKQQRFGSELARAVRETKLEAEALDAATATMLARTVQGWSDPEDQEAEPFERRALPIPETAPRRRRRRDQEFAGVIRTLASTRPTVHETVALPRFFFAWCTQQIDDGTDQRTAIDEVFTREEIFRAVVPESEAALRRWVDTEGDDWRTQGLRRLESRSGDIAARADDFQATLQHLDGRGPAMKALLNPPKFFKRWCLERIDDCDRARQAGRQPEPQTDALAQMATRVFDRDELLAARDHL